MTIREKEIAKAAHEYQRTEPTDFAGVRDFINGAKWADKNPHLDIWHTREELNQFQGNQAYIFCDNFHIVEASYCGGGIGKEPHFTVNGLLFDNRQMLLWCDRMELINKTNWMEKYDETKKN